MRGELVKHGRGFLPCSDESEAVHKRMVPGEIVWVKFLRIRDPVSHRRYWALMNLCAQNCERIKLPRGGVMPVHSKEDVHTAIKLCTGYVDTIFDDNQNPVAFIPKSTSFENMTEDEWREWWSRVMDAVCEVVLPGVSIPEVQTEIMSCMGMAG
jgi:hypothetical protein